METLNVLDCISKTNRQISNIKLDSNIISIYFVTGEIYQLDISIDNINMVLSKIDAMKKDVSKNNQDLIVKTSKAFIYSVVLCFVAVSIVFLAIAFVYLNGFSEIVLFVVGGALIGDSYLIPQAITSVEDYNKAKEDMGNQNLKGKIEDLDSLTMTLTTEKQRIVASTVENSVQEDKNEDRYAKLRHLYTVRSELVSLSQNNKETIVFGKRL